MENCTIYSHGIDFNKVIEIIKSGLPKAVIDTSSSGLEKKLTATIKGGLFSKSSSLQINWRQRQTPSYQLEAVSCDLTKNLSGMVNFIQSLPAQNERIRNKFLHKVMAANSEIAFMAEPTINREFEAVLKTLALELEAFVFASPNHVFNKSDVQHFTDKQLNLIIDLNGRCEIDELEVNVEAKYHDGENEPTAAQTERKLKSEKLLTAREIKVNQHLPYVPDAATVNLRTSREMIDRAYALLVIAAKGEGVEQFHLEKTVKEKNIDSFSPQESMLYHAKALTEQQRGNATWRYESLNMILWALGKVEPLGDPGEICDVEAMVGLLLNSGRTAFENSVNLKSKTEILDQLDLIYRMHWACVDARIKGMDVGGNIHAGIVYERHYALNWLLNEGGLDWDDVQTNT